MGVCRPSCSGKLTWWQKCLCRGDIRKRKSPHPRRKPRQTWLVTQEGKTGHCSYFQTKLWKNHVFRALMLISFTDPCLFLICNIADTIVLSFFIITWKFDYIFFILVPEPPLPGWPQFNLLTMALPVSRHTTDMWVCELCVSFLLMEWQSVLKDGCSNWD